MKPVRPCLVNGKAHLPELLYGEASPPAPCYPQPTLRRDLSVRRRPCGRGWL